MILQFLKHERSGTLGLVRTGGVRFRGTLDGHPPGPAHGSDLNHSGDGTLVEERPHLVMRPYGRIADRQLEIEFLDAGAEAFAFTFG